MDEGFLNNRLEKRKADNSYRQLPVNQNAGIDFSSNDYLGFARRSSLWETVSLPKYGSTGSRLLTGNDAKTEETEAFIARFHRAEAGLIYNSGYDANLGLFSCIASKDDTIIYDEYSHASIKDGARLSPARHFIFRHNDLNDLEARISRASGKVFVAVESVYSMDGDLADLKGLVRLSKKYDHVYLIADEAHATGVFGERGEGLIQLSGLENHFFARVHTFGKALGCQGAIVLGSSTLKNYLVNFSRSFIYTTALPLPDIIAVRKAYELLDQKDQAIQLLRDRINYFKRKSKELSAFNVKPNESAIQVMVIPGNEKVKSVANYLQSGGFDVRPVLSPTVPVEMERLRICIHSFNTEKEIDDLIVRLNEEFIE